MSSKQTENTIKPADGNCDKCAYWCDEGYMQCPKCLKRLRYDPAEYITETILALPDHKRDYDAATKLDYIDFNYTSHFTQVSVKVREKFPNERYFLQVVVKPTNGTLRLLLSDNKVVIKTTQSFLLESTYPALGCLDDLVMPTTPSLMFIVEPELKHNLIYDNCLRAHDGTLTNIKAIFAVKYHGAVDTLVALSNMERQDRDRIKKYLFPM